jgi:hypothetical protein
MALRSRPARGAGSASQTTVKRDSGAELNVLKLNVEPEFRYRS